MDSNFKVKVIQILICLMLAGIWEFCGTASSDVFFYLGTPSAVCAEFKSMLLEENLLSHFVVTGGEAVSGMLIGTFLGSVVGLSLWYSEFAALIAKPFIVGLGTLPIFAFAPLMIVWFGIGFSMKVAMAAFSTVFVAFNQGYRGAKSVSVEYVDTLKGMDASRHQIFRRIIVPGSIDWVLSSMRLNVGFGLLGAFIGEFIAADKGLGYLILRAGGLYNIPRAIAAAIGITILALLLDSIAAGIERQRYHLVQLLSVPSCLWRHGRLKTIAVFFLPNRNTKEL